MVRSVLQPEVPAARGTVIVSSTAGPPVQPAIEAAPTVADEAKVDPRTGRFLPGVMVEYKSRTSGQWIVAKVEYFDDKSNSYRLDVQPHAHPDRVRARQMSQANSPDARQDRVLAGSQPPVGSKDGPPVASTRRDESPRRQIQQYPSILPAYTQPVNTVVQLQEEDKPVENFGAMAQSASGQQDLYKQQRDRAPEQVMWEPRADPAPLQTNIIQNAGPQNIMGNHNRDNGYPSNDPSAASPATKMLKEVVSVNSPREGNEGVDVFGDTGRGGDVERYRTEAETLRRQVARLQTENGVLKERLSAEAALKDRYFAELCICNEQLQRLRTTPR